MMNWQLPLLFAQSDGEQYRESVEKAVQAGTTVPDSALHSDHGYNFMGGDYWFPPQASEFAYRVDNLYMGIFYISLVCFVGIVITAVYFCIKYRRKGNVIDPPSSPSHNTGLEILWSVIPSILMVWMFYEGAAGFFAMRTPREDSEEIHVMATQFNWLFTYPNGDSSAELHLVLDRPTRLIMQSKDVLHSFFVPAFRQKMDVVPGRYTYAYILPKILGQYRLTCAEYCGEGHSRMRTMAQVHISEADRTASTEWIKAKYSAWEHGERIYKINCSGCHKIDGTRATGPALNLVWGKGEEEMITGQKVKIDRQYIQDSIWTPEKDVVATFGPTSKMNSFKGQLDEEDINDVVEYLKYLNDPKSVSSTPVGELTDNEKTEEVKIPAPKSDTSEKKSDDPQSEKSTTETQKVNPAKEDSTENKKTELEKKDSAEAKVDTKSADDESTVGKSSDQKPEEEKSEENDDAATSPDLEAPANQ